MSYQPIPDKTQVRGELIGTRLSRYELVEKIGDGKNGAVYRARHVDTGQLAAIKVTREAVAEREVRAASVLGHPGIATVHGFGRLPDGSHYVVMELMEGEGLDWALHRTHTLLVPQVVQVLDEVADALNAAHERSLAHGYLRPSSVFLVNQPSGGFRVKLLDFGISPPAGAPEPSVDGDLRALGLLGYAMLTGRLEAPVPLPRPIVPVLPLVLEELVGDLVEAASKLRPRTALEVRARLVSLLPLPSPALVEPAPPVAAPEPPPSRLKVVLPAALAAVALIAMAVVLAWPDDPPVPEPLVMVAPPAPAPVPVAPVAVAVRPAAPEPRTRRPLSPKPAVTPSAAELESRLTRLDARLRKKPGDHSEAIGALSKQRLRLSGSPDADERREVSRQLDAWEQTWLAK